MAEGVDGEDVGVGWARRVPARTETARSWGMNRRSTTKEYSETWKNRRTSHNKKRGNLWRGAENGAYYTRERRAGRFFLRRTSFLHAFHGSHFSMKPGTITHTIAVLLSSLSAVFTPNAAAAGSTGTVKVSKKASKPLSDTLLKVDPYASSAIGGSSSSAQSRRTLPLEKEYRHDHFLDW